MLLASTCRYGRRLLRYEWRAHLNAAHLEELKILQFLVEDVQEEALFEWQSQPERNRQYLQRVSPSTTPLPTPAAQPQDPAAGPAIATEPAATVSATGAPEGPPLPALSCPFGCGMVHLPPGEEFVRHLVVSHLPDVQVCVHRSGCGCGCMDNTLLTTHYSMLVCSCAAVQFGWPSALQRAADYRRWAPA